MKKQLAGRLTQISAEALKNPTLIEKEITAPNPKNKRLTAPDLWNIGAVVKAVHAKIFTIEKKHFQLH